MKLDMTDEQRHDIYVNHSAQMVWTGKVENGWMWYHPRFPNDGGPELTREAALAAAVRELNARII
jgi:hypothetical protein